MKTLILISALLISTSAFASHFKLSSPQIKQGKTIAMEQVLNSFGCTGGNVSPELSWTGAPKDTKSFAVTMYDPDAPTGSGWWHWVVFNIPANVSKINLGSGSKDGELPDGAVQSNTDFNAPGYGGPCPPEGDKPHRYFFKVFALKVEKLPLDEKAPGAMAGYYINANKIAVAELMAKFGRAKLK